jgi:multidrug efflux system outer membrane protein
MMKRPQWIITTLAASVLAACSMAPSYERPVAPVAQGWKAAGAGEYNAAELGWREYFAEERLQRLITLALENNRDLRVATANIDKARAQYQVQRAAQLPAINATGGESATRTPAQLSTTGQDRVSRQYSAGIGMASWELDFFGRIQSLKDQALAQYLATEEARNSTQISLIAELANAWLTLAADRERQKFSQATLDAQRNTLNLAQRRFDVGTSSGLDLAQARAALEAARVDVARYAALVEQDFNAVTLLTGGEVPAELLPLALPERVTQAAELPAGLPAETLLKRPDVRAAEQQLIAANANIGAARAAFFPRISLTASTGFASPSLEGLLSGDNRTWSFAPQISIPIFAGGANIANLDAAKASQRAQLATYEKTLQSAFRDVADALAQRATIGEQLEAQQALSQAYSDALRLTQARYDKGVSNYVLVLDAQRSDYSAQQNLITTRLAREQNRVELYKQLGGGLKE